MCTGVVVVRSYDGEARRQASYDEERKPYEQERGAQERGGVHIFHMACSFLRLLDPCRYRSGMTSQLH